MRTVSIVKTGLGSGAAILFAGLLAAAPAQASTGGSVPCNSAALIAAITAANTAGGGAINLAPRCHYRPDESGQVTGTGCRRSRPGSR